MSRKKGKGQKSKVKGACKMLKVLTFYLLFFAIFVISIGVFALAIELRIPPSPQLSTINYSSLIPSPPTTYNLQATSSLFLPILVYHHIGTPSPSMTSAEKSFFIEQEWFEKHLQYLQKNNFQTVSFSDVADHFSKGTPVPQRAIIISFDDGWKSAFDAALPILQKYNMTATVFIPTKLIAEKPGKSMRLSWDDLAQLRDAGWEIGSHSLWHPYLTKSRKARAEIFESKKILEEHLDIEVTAFAYPFGDYNEKTEALVKEAGYTTARSFTSGKGVSPENIFHMPVVRVYANVGLERWKKQLFEN